MTASHFKPFLTALVPLALIFANPAFAEDDSPADAGKLRSFEPSYFTQYAPRTALDMLGRIPGFQLKSGNTERGLGQGGANVLINGQQITGKGNDAFSQVGRINAGNVVRIDIVDGASLDIPGLSGQIANIISKTTGVSGTWEWKPEWRTDLKANTLRGTIAVSGETGDLSYSAELENDSSRRGHWGPETQTNGQGELLRTLQEKADASGDNPGATINLTWKPAEDRVGHLNLEYNQFNFNRKLVSKIEPGTDTDFTGENLFSFAEDEWNAKIDGDYEFPLMDGKLKLIGYYRTERSPTYARFKHFALNGDLESHTEYHQIADEGEAIGRAEYSWSPSDGRDWQVATEGAYNVLSIGATFFDFFDGTEDYSASLVEEYRSETTLTHTRQLSPKWDLQLSAGGEYSQISQGPKSREFIRPKGFVSATYKPKDDFSIRGKIERDVGQLNFFDFISSVSLEDNLDTAGNSDLIPSQSWAGVLEFDRQFKDGHSISTTFYGSLISDLVDRIPLRDETGAIIGDAVGNIDNAHRYGVDINSTIKGDAFGLKGVELEAELNLRNSSVEDPLGGFDRRLNGDLKSYWNLNFRHDIPDTDWAYGIFADQFRDAPVYRLTTRNQFTFDGPFVFAFVEHKDIMGLKIRATLMNLLDASDDFERIIYDDSRDVGNIELVESHSREFDLFFRLNVSGTF
ncbi:MAG: hypothetical protein HKN36_02010 [Hellea sp.]|nr:hypothetical protein [Hellea sp.]